MSLTWFTSEVVKCTQLIDALSGAFLLEMVQEEFKREIESEKYIHLMSKTVQSYDWQKTSWNQRQDYLRREYVDSHLSYLYWMAKWQSKSPQWNPRILPLRGELFEETTVILSTKATSSLSHQGCVVTLWTTHVPSPGIIWRRQNALQDSASFGWVWVLK